MENSNGCDDNSNCRRCVGKDEPCRNRRIVARRGHARWFGIYCGWANVTWDESGVSAVVETVPVAVEVAPVADVPDFAKMTKEQIEIHVRDNYGVELDRRLTKAKLVAQANTAANG